MSDLPRPGWRPGDPGVVRLPGGSLVRGRSRRSTPSQHPDWALSLAGRPPSPEPWPTRWLRWRDFALPTDEADALDALHEALRRSGQERVEVVCGGGIGRTGTAIAALAVLDGLPATEAVVWVREHYHPRAVETPWQRRWLRRLGTTR